MTLNTWNPDALGGFPLLDLGTFDATVGIAGFEVESFEDAFLIPGLSVEGGDRTTTNTLEPADIDMTHPDSFWDFATSLRLNVNASLVPGDIAFTLPGGVRSFGVGIGDVETDVEFFVNDTSFGQVRDLPNFKATGNASNQPRQVYIRVDATDGFPDIATVRFVQTNGGSGDILFFDRLAISPTPISVPVLGVRGGFGLVGLMIAVGIAALSLPRVKRRRA